MQKPYLHIKQTPAMGRGVFTDEAIPADTVIEAAPVVVMTKEDRLHLDKTKLHDYIFEWGEDSKQCCMALGLIPMYNHSYKSNCEYIMDFETDTIYVQTVRPITKGEELTINYNGDWNDATPLWFDAK
jgi:SET domain-containing protein